MIVLWSGKNMIDSPNKSPRWGTWFIDWAVAEYCGDGWDIWHKEMLSDHEWYRDFWEAQDHYLSMCYYADWQESSTLARLVHAIYYAWGFSFWQVKLALLKLETQIILVQSYWLKCQIRDLKLRNTRLREKLWKRW